MSMLQSFTVKPHGIYPMTVKAMDTNHLDQILSEMFAGDCWKVLADDAPVEITPSTGKGAARPVKDFRS
jgi:hypothetical protein